MKQAFSLLLCLCMLLGLLSPALAEGEAVINLLGDHAQCIGSGASATGSQVLITTGGTYTITGSLTDGCITIEAGKKDQVTLILHNADVHCSSGAALLVSKAGSVTLMLEDGTVNRLSSGDAMAAPADEKASGAALQAKCDLTLSGSGALTVQGCINQGIRTTKNMTVEGGMLTVEAASAGIRCKGSLTMHGGSLAITSGGDGIHAGTEAAEEQPAEGQLIVSGGVISINAQGDAMQSETTLAVSGGEITVITGGGSASAPAHPEEMFGRGFDRRDMAQTAAETDSVSRKGLKSAGNMVISGGTLTLDTYDDGLCARSDLTVEGGVILLASGDDGVHADGTLTICGGTLTVTSSYEGLEAMQILISDGTVNVTADDDGLNATDGSSSEFGNFGHWGGKGGDRMGKPDWSQGQRNGPMPAAVNGQTPPEMPGAAASASPRPLLHISGGTVTVNARGDGLDSNGDLLISGGVVIVDGPDNSGNGALDAGTESGGTLRVTGGTVLAIGAVGMNETFDSSSTQAVLNANLRWNAGDEIAISDMDGNVLLRHTAARSGQSVICSDALLVNGAPMTVTAGAASVQVTVGDTSGTFGGMGHWGDRPGR